MAERNPPSWLQGGSHPAEHDRLLLGALVPQEGVVTSADLLVSQNGTPNMSVNVAAGSAFVRHDLATHGGTYHAYNDAEVNLAIGAAHATNPRHDLVVAVVRDAQYSGGTDAWALEVLEGTPASSPADPAVPTDGSYLLLARVVVGAAVSSITDANITDLRARAAVPANVATPVGSVLPYAGAAAPAGWLLADGSAVSRTTYAALFTVLGTTYGAGDGSSTFNLPDLRSRSVLGAGAGAGLTSRTLGATGGAETHVLTLSQVPGHSHTVASHNHGGSTVSSESGHVHALNHVHALSGGVHSHSADGDYGERFGVSSSNQNQAWVRGNAVNPNHNHGGAVADDNSVGLEAALTDIEPENILSPGGGGTALSVSSQNGNSQAGSSHSHSVTVAAQAPGTDSQGGGTSHPNMHPWLALNHIIRAY